MRDHKTQSMFRLAGQTHKKKEKAMSMSLELGWRNKKALEALTSVNSMNLVSNDSFRGSSADVSMEEQISFAGNECANVSKLV